jgi:DNA-binding response OmpR family regulator
MKDTLNKNYAKPNTNLIRQGLITSASHFLQKPFTGAELLATVRQLLEVAPAPMERELAACAS